MYRMGHRSEVGGRKVAKSREVFSRLEGGGQRAEGGGRRAEVDKKRRKNFPLGTTDKTDIPKMLRPGLVQNNIFT